MEISSFTTIDDSRLVVQICNGDVGPILRAEPLEFIGARSVRAAAPIDEDHLAYQWLNAFVIHVEPPDEEFPPPLVLPIELVVDQPREALGNQKKNVHRRVLDMKYIRQILQDAFVHAPVYKLRVQFPLPLDLIVVLLPSGLLVSSKFVRHYESEG
jgi:hypothetical protein